MMAQARTLAFGLAHMNHPPFGGGKPLIDMLFVWLLHDCLAVTADKCKDLHPLFHGKSSKYWRWFSMSPNFHLTIVPSAQFTSRSIRRMSAAATRTLQLSERHADRRILSSTLFNDDRLKAVAFGFAQGEDLSEHTASMPAVLHFLQGEAKLTLDDDTGQAKSGTWVHMPKGMRHSIQAKSPEIMLLTLLK
jgi:quercetin dioxygenase-like cupin family protein